LYETLIIFGAISGAVLALLALGFTLIYGVANVVNMAHGTIFMYGAYMFFIFGPFGTFGLDPVMALILSAITMAIMGSIVYVIFIHPVMGDEVAGIVSTVCAALILQQIIFLDPPLGFGGEHKGVPPLVSGSTTILGVTVTNSKILAFVVSLVLIATISIFIAKTKIGRAMKAVSQDREVAMLMGINTPRLYIITIAISSALAAVAGILITGSASPVAEPHMWLTPLMMSFAIVILGGLGSIKGTLIAGFIVGYVGETVVYFVPEGVFLKGAIALAVMVTVLVIRPKGLFGKRIELED